MDRIKIITVTASEIIVILLTIVSYVLYQDHMAFCIFLFLKVKRGGGELPYDSIFLHLYHILLIVSIAIMLRKEFQHVYFKVYQASMLGHGCDPYAVSAGGETEKVETSHEGLL